MINTKILLVSCCTGLISLVAAAKASLAECLKLKADHLWADRILREIK